MTKRIIPTAILFLLVIVFHSGTISAQLQSDRIVVDDFEKPGKKNSLGGDFGAFSDKEGLGHCYLFFSENKGSTALTQGHYALYIQWDTSKDGAFGGYWTELKHLNLESYNYVSFYVKGLKGGEVFKVGLRGPVNSSFETKVEITKALKSGITTDWQKVTIPLKWFSAVEKWDDVNVFSINFEKAFGSEKGAILLDDIAFEQ